MSSLAGDAARLFAMPGQSGSLARPIIRLAAATHEALLAEARATIDDSCRNCLSMLVALLPRVPATKQRLLCHSVLIEGLHCLAPFCATLKRWHQCVASPGIFEQRPCDAPVGGMILGNTLLALLLRSDRCWCGKVDLSTDRFGQVRFPLSDWSISVNAATTDRSGILAGEAVTLKLDAHQARWSRGEQADDPFLIMPRAACVRMIAENDNSLDHIDMTAPDPQVKPRIQCAAPLCAAGARYVPVQFPDSGMHAAICGGLAKQMHDGVRENSPCIHRGPAILTGAICGG